MMRTRAPQRGRLFEAEEEEVEVEEDSSSSSSSSSGQTSWTIGAAVLLIASLRCPC